MLFAEESAKGLLNDPWTFGLLIVGLLGSWTALAFSLGANLARLRSVEQKQENTDQIIKDIFDELKALATKTIPHSCGQIERITRIEGLATETRRRVESLEHYRDEQSGRASRIAEREHNDASDSSIGRRDNIHG